MTEQVTQVGNFGSIISKRPEQQTWVPASFPLPGGGVWTFQEPDAVVVVQDGRLRVAAAPYTRSHDAVQILDNAKHMYFSTVPFEAPADGRLEVSWDMSATIVNGRANDLYDGFVSFHLMDLPNGVAIDIFASNDTVATVYARLPFPGAHAPRPESGPRFFSLFDEFAGRTSIGQWHRYKIVYDRAAAELEFWMDGECLKREEQVVDIGPVVFALGMMTEKDIVPGKGSISCRGQGAVASWGNIEVKRAGTL